MSTVYPQCGLHTLISTLKPQIIPLYIVAISVVPDIELSPIDLENLALIAQQLLEFLLDRLNPTVVSHTKVAIPDHNMV